MYPNVVKQEDGTCLLVSSIREFLYINDKIAYEMILNKLARCSVSNIVASNGFKDLEEEEEIKWKIFQGRAKYLENERISTF